MNKEVEKKLFLHNFCGVGRVWFNASDLKPDERKSSASSNLAPRATGRIFI